MIDGATNTVITTLATGYLPAAIDVNPITNTIYVADANSHDVWVINGATNTLTTTIHQLTPSGLAVDPVTNTIYVPNGSNVSVISGATNKVTATIGVVGAGLGAGYVAARR